MRAATGVVRGGAVRTVAGILVPRRQAVLFRGMHFNMMAFCPFAFRAIVLLRMAARVVSATMMRSAMTAAFSGVGDGGPEHPCPGRQDRNGNFP